MSGNDDKYPELLSDLAGQAAEFLTQEGLSDERAADVGYRLAEYVRQHWGGQQIYLPKGRVAALSLRDREIYSRFNGRNADQLAREYKLTRVRIYQIIKAARAES